MIRRGTVVRNADAHSRSVVRTRLFLFLEPDVALELTPFTGIAILGPSCSLVVRGVL
jgi:hypothetical protein